MSFRRFKLLFRTGLRVLLLTSAVCVSAYLAVGQEVPAGDLLRAVVDQELKSAAEDHTHWMFVLKNQKDGRQQEELIVQTADGPLSQLLAINGNPLTPEQQKQEDRRIEKLLHNPDEQKKAQRARQEDARHTENLLRLLPQATVASYGARENERVEILFKPNPDFHPHSTEAAVFHHMQGSIWIDTRTDRLAEIQGHLLDEVKFGGGLLGHLDRGGEFHVKQTEVAPGYWAVTLLHVNMSGRALFFKTIGVHEDEIRTEFRRVPDDLSLSAAAEELRKQSTVKSVGNNRHRQPNPLSLGL